MSYNIPVGTCSLCGGAVCIPSDWLATVPPTPTCARCGAVPVEAHGPVMPMRPRRDIAVTGGRLTISTDGTWKRTP